MDIPNNRDDEINNIIYIGVGILKSQKIQTKKFRLNSFASTH